MKPLDIIQSENNLLLIRLHAGEDVVVFRSFIASGDFRVHAVMSSGLAISRWLAGRLMECHFAAKGGERTVQLYVDKPYRHGKFLVHPVAEGQKQLIRLPALAAYRLGKGGRFVSARKLWSPVRWFTGTAFAVVAVGPVDLVLYGANLVLKNSQEHPACFANHLVAFDALTPFRIHSLRPEGHVGTWFDALSSIVDVEFQKATPLIQGTTGDGRQIGTRVRQAVSLVFGTFICGSLLEHLFFSSWLWSWLR